ncbi:hydroxymethylglutaryl-CoA lyase [Bradyrhizobium sp. DOA9]|uniref:hydroxymethylglutaryl-CoA lyase n=1 Tax=Bradyrhizobium sp. DOA9 TaxID=1126627 RepID=UPI000469A735|nr:hydroxymethylglutaryl-CoA lyase [Bradyrhizobium sp. DOA9]GAJ37929.1 hydroxymethylglutaryl-CoA lyase [Bradyrhizobium sp. DOA9]
MTDLPARVEINEEGPREGFQIEPGPIETGDKVRLIEALAGTGVAHIQACSFVSPKLVPGWRDADAVVRGFSPRSGVEYTGLWFNERGLDRALAHADKLSLRGAISLSASDDFSRRNLNRSHAENLERMRSQTTLHLSKNVPVTRVGVMAAFGCNFQGEVTVADVVRTVGDGFGIAGEAGISIDEISLSDTMGWAIPSRIEAVVGAVRERWPDQRIKLHLHDTRGMAVANAAAGLRLGVDKYDSTVGGLGGCPFAAHAGAAGNIATEELVMLCEEMGIETGIDLDALIEAGRLAESIVGHPLPSELLHAGSLHAARRKVMQ